MVHPTTQWALLYGLADPAIPAQAVLDGRPDQLRELAGCFRSVAGAASDGRRLAARADMALRSGWSNPAALLAVQSLVAAFRSATGLCAPAADALDGYAATVMTSRAAVRRAYADADATIDARGLLRTAFDWPPGGFLTVIHERRAVVDGLHRTVTAVSNTLDDAAGRLLAALAPDPRRMVPPTAPGTASPSSDRAVATDAANRAQLTADLTSPSRQRRSFAAAVQNQLLAAAAHGMSVQLLSYDPTHPSGQGGAAVAIGDVAHADAVAVLVPGVGNSPTGATGPLEAAARLTAAVTAGMPGSTSAAVVWLGYDVPLSRGHDVTAVPGLDPVGSLLDAALAANAVDATAAGEQLAAFSRNLRGMMDPSSGLTLIGHSYGSTVVSQAATVLGPEAGVDDIVLLASPGVGYGPTSADDYSAVPADHVYALAFQRDPVALPVTDLAAAVLQPLPTHPPGGPFGADPMAAGFGAQVIDAPSSVPAGPGPPDPLAALLAPTAAAPMAGAGADPITMLKQHRMDNYLSGAALAAVAAVVAGRYARVPIRSRR